jgi:hypothetical protein
MKRLLSLIWEILFGYALDSQKDNSTCRYRRQKFIKAWLRIRYKPYYVSKIRRSRKLFTRFVKPIGRGIPKWQKLEGSTIFRKFLKKKTVENFPKPLSKKNKIFDYWVGPPPRTSPRSGHSCPSWLTSARLNWLSYFCFPLIFRETSFQTN